MNPTNSMTDQCFDCNAPLRKGEVCGCAMTTEPAQQYACWKQVSWFLSDVMTAAGLVSHGKQSKALGERLGSQCMEVGSMLFAMFNAQRGAVPAGLLDALRFYANGGHFTMHDSSAWDTVSGEPPNFYEDESCTATVEDGSIAKLALQGKFFTDQEYQEPLVDGEVFNVAHAPPAGESDKRDAGTVILTRPDVISLLSLIENHPTECAKFIRAAMSREQLQGGE